MYHLIKYNYNNSFVLWILQEETDYHKKNAMMDVCIATIGALCKHLPWSAYKAQLKQAMVLLAKLHSNKMTVRSVVCSLCICIFYILYFDDIFLYIIIDAELKLLILLCLLSKIIPLEFLHRCQLLFLWCMMTDFSPNQIFWTLRLTFTLMILSGPRSNPPPHLLHIIRYGKPLTCPTILYPALTCCWEITQENDRLS